MKINVLNKSGESIGDIEISPNLIQEDFSERSFKLIKEVLEYHRNKKRTAHPNTKGISDVSGTGRKAYAQKGTGRARHGSLRRVQFRGGAVVFGPNGREYSYEIPKKKKRKALSLVFTDYFKGEKIRVVDSLDFGSFPKIKEIFTLMSNLKASNPLIIGEENSPNIKNVINNLFKHHYLGVGGLNILDIYKHNTLVFTKGALESLNRRFSE